MKCDKCGFASGQWKAFVERDTEHKLETKAKEFGEIYRTMLAGGFTVNLCTKCSNRWTRYCLTLPQYTAFTAAKLECEKNPSIETAVAYASAELTCFLKAEQWVQKPLETTNAN